MLFPYGRVVGHMITVLIRWDLASWIWRISGETDAAANYGTHKIRSAAYSGILLLIVMKICLTPCRSIAGIACILQPAWNTQAKTSGSKNTGILLLLPASCYLRRHAGSYGTHDNTRYPLLRPQPHSTLIFRLHSRHAATIYGNKWCSVPIQYIPPLACCYNS